MSKGKLRTKDVIVASYGLAQQAYRDIDTLLDDMGTDDGSRPEFYYSRIAMRYGLLSGLTDLFNVISKESGKIAEINEDEREAINKMHEMRRLAYSRLTNAEEYLRGFRERDRRRNKQ